MTAPQPAFAEFERVYAEGRGQALWTTLVADLETPVSAYLKLADGKTNTFLLESVQGGETRGRYSIVGLKPDLIWRVRGDAAEIDRHALSGAGAFEPESGGALAALRRLLAESRMTLPTHLPPMAAGLFGYLGYDMVRLMERLAQPNPDPLGLPDAMLVRPTVLAIFDTVRDEITLVAPVWPDGSVPARAAYARAAERLSDAIADLSRALPAVGGDVTAASLSAPVSNTPKSVYLEMVERAKAYIRAGDVFQVVPSQRFSTAFPLPPFALYRALRRINPSPYLYFLAFDGFAVVGSSPEILVRVRDGAVTLRPIAGTAPRGGTPEDDAALATALLADPKERAEHLMLLDLGRNDVGRVAATGTVKVTEQFVIERYSHVMHIVSNVEGRLDPAREPLDAVIAGFPAGTLTGAPKVRAMEIIDELEAEKRGVYGGAVGYFSANGSIDTCIALRTAIVKDGVMYVQAGGGVVADSDPEAEHQETVNKSKALIRAAEEAVRFATAPGRRQ